MKILLIVVAVAIVMALVVLLSVYIGCLLGFTGVVAIMEDAFDKEIVADFDIDEEKAESYIPDMASIKTTFKELMPMLLKEHILMKCLIRAFKIKR